MHELTHQYHGEQAAREIRDARCFGAQDVLEYWIEQNTEYDRLTGHGASEGHLITRGLN